MKITGGILRSQREFKGFLLRQVAAKLDIDTAILSKIERGERKPTREQISKLADILELNKDNLIIQFMSEKIAYEIADEELGLQILKESERKYKLIKK
jgi:transcriptional regulator with XRE-family HTH domain